MALSKIGTAGIADDTAVNGFTPTASNMAGRNRIINGDMRISQRGAGPAGVTSETYVLDRWNSSAANGPTCTVEQSTAAPDGFVNSLKYTVTTGATIDAGDYSDIRQYVEGLNLSDIGWGTANPKTVTLSFWVRSSVTGTFAVSFVNSAYDRCYPATYTINSADTWEYKTVSVTGPTNGTWLTSNGVGMRVVWDLGIGSSYSRTVNQWDTVYAGFAGTGVTKLAATTGATFYITGVQLEAGSVATPFEHRQYGQELALCQRYYETSHGITWSSTGYHVSYIRSGQPFLVEKRSGPTVSFFNVTNSGGASISISSSQSTKTHLGWQADNVGTSYGLSISYNASAEL
jgi:hypothetical protein